MKITIHRGSNQIGRCITEYEIDGWKVFVDNGEQLPGESALNGLEINGLNKGELSKSILLITHYHNDHIGNIDVLNEKLPIYMGAVTKDILGELSNHLKSVCKKEARMAKRLETVKTFKAGEVIKFGDFLITPFTLDHSAFDSYAFKIEAKGLKVFHTGDFSTHGFRRKKIFKLLDKYVGQVDYVVCEGTNIVRPDVLNKSEYQLQKEYEETFRNNKGNIIYVSSTNIDRLFSLYQAALRAGRPFYVDPFQKRVMDIVTKPDILWDKSRLYKYGKFEPIALKYDSNEYLFTNEFHDFLDEKGYVLIASATDRFDKLIEKLPDEKKKYLSMWKGYIKLEYTVFNPKLAKSIGKDGIYLHTSCHTDMESLFKFFEALNPKVIIPLHTDNPKKFADFFSEKWPILLLKDGESFRPVKDPGYDTTTSSFVAVKKLDEDIPLVSAEDDEKCYSLDEKYLGEFLNEKEALFAIKNSEFAPKRILGYLYEEIEDMEPWVTITYTENFDCNAKFSRGNHAPGEKEFQTPADFQPGEKVLCLIYGFKIIFPAIYEGPITLDYLQELYEKDEIIKSQYDTFEDYIKEGVWDSEWDSVIVKPLVKIDDEDWHERMLVRRPFIFPYKKFNL